MVMWQAINCSLPSSFPLRAVKECKALECVFMLLRGKEGVYLWAETKLFWAPERKERSPAWFVAMCEPGAYLGRGKLGNTPGRQAQEWEEGEEPSLGPPRRQGKGQSQLSPIGHLAHIPPQLGHKGVHATKHKALLFPDKPPGHTTISRLF